MKRTILAAIFSCAALMAQETTHKIVDLRYADAGAVATLLNTFPVQTRYARADSRVLSLTGSAASITAAEDAIRRIDVAPPPPKNIDLMIYMITAGDPPSQPSKMPSDLDPLIKQLRSSFGYTSYNLLETFAIRTRDGDGAESNGFAPPPVQAQTSMGQKTFYQCKIGQARIEPTARGNIIRLHRVSLGLKVPLPSNSGGGFNYNDVGVNTSIDLREAEKVMVGKANITGTEKSAFIFVVAAKVVD